MGPPVPGEMLWNVVKSIMEQHFCPEENYVGGEIWGFHATEDVSVLLDLGLYRLVSRCWHFSNMLASANKSIWHQNLCHHYVGCTCYICIQSNPIRVPLLSTISIGIKAGMVVNGHVLILGVLLFIVPYGVWNTLLHLRTKANAKLWSIYLYFVMIPSYTVGLFISTIISCFAKYQFLYEVCSNTFACFLMTSSTSVPIFHN